MREAVPGDDNRLADVLARTFWDDPISTYLLPDDASRYPYLRRFYKVELHSYRRRRHVLTTEDLSGAAMWAQPNAWKNTVNEMLRAALPAALVFRRSAVNGIRLLTAIERAHPSEPHWYLGILGTDPGRQGLGVGGALITAVTERCDREGLPAYLESSKEVNVPYYERFGFRVTDEVQLPGAPRIWLMWRNAQ